MRFFSLGKNQFSLLLTTVVTVGFLISGLFRILDYFIVKVLLFISFGSLFIIALLITLKSNRQKNRLEEKLQDDSH